MNNLKKDKSVLIGALLLAFAASSFVLAQTSVERHNPANRVQHRVHFLTNLLSLTPEQQQQATTIFTNAATTGQSQHDSLKTAHQALRDAVKSNNTAAIDQNATVIGNSMAQMISNRAKAQAAFYQILTPDQQAKFGEFESEHHGFHGRHPHMPAE